MFTAEAIKARARQQPFVPLRIATSAGETFDVFHPDLIWVGEREVHVGMPSKKNPALYDLTARLAILHISALQDLPPLSAKQNGHTATGQ